MTHTIRLKIPQWQGGNNPTYSLGSELLSWLVPKNDQQKEVDVPIPIFEAPLEKENGVTAQSIVAANVDRTAEVIAEENPDKIITLGGDCLVSQAPFDYLHGKYGSDLGIIWLDAHPDISTPEIFYNEHAMVLGNLLGQGDPVLAEKVQHPFDAASVLYVGLQQPSPDEHVLLDEMGMDYQVQTEKMITPDEVKAWLKKNGFTKAVVHFDLDVLDPKEFRMLYFAEPSVEEYGVAGGKMTLDQVKEIILAIAEQSEVVGLTIAELLPWDVKNLQKLFNDFEIFF
ncbi:arginase family protein [Enterococcus sp. AZ109]|uniref:arginase family protein n=1 Tax=Enterococcus sp. AZ109 TaxID=2774634 RepID=UPI003F24760A